jgi:hypothetical protein
MMWFIPWPHDPEGRAGLVIDAEDALEAINRGRLWHLGKLEDGVSHSDPLDSRYQPVGEPLWGEVSLVPGCLFEVRGGHGERFAADGN